MSWCARTIPAAISAAVRRQMAGRWSRAPPGMGQCDSEPGSVDAQRSSATGSLCGSVTAQAARSVVVRLGCERADAGGHLHIGPSPAHDEPVGRHLKSCPVHSPQHAPPPQHPAMATPRPRGDIPISSSPFWAVQLFEYRRWVAEPWGRVPVEIRHHSPSLSGGHEKARCRKCNKMDNRRASSRCGHALRCRPNRAPRVSRTFAIPVVRAYRQGGCCPEEHLAQRGKFRWPVPLPAEDCP